MPAKKKVYAQVVTPKPAKKPALISNHAEAVKKNLGKSQSLRDFLIGAGWL